MSIEIEVLTEAYGIMKQYISVKDRQEMADNLMSVLVDALSDDDLREFGAFDTPLKHAYKEYMPVDEEDENYNDEDE